MANSEFDIECAACGNMAVVKLKESLTLEFANNAEPQGPYVVITPYCGHCFAEILTRLEQSQ